MTDMRDNIARIVADEKNGGDPYDIAEDIIAALPGMVAPLVWDEWDGGLTSACTPWGKYILGQDLCLSIPGNGSLRRYETEFAAKAAANAHHAAAVVAAFTGSKQ